MMKENNTKTYTYSEVVEMLMIERQRAVDICYQQKKHYEESAKYKKLAGYDLYFIDNNIANELRCTGNAISGLNALSGPCGETMRDLIEKNLNQTI